MVSIQHSPDLVYTFWESMDADAREKILKMTSRCLSVTVFACTNAPGETIEAVCSTLNESSPGVKAWKLADKFSTAAIGGIAAAAAIGGSGYIRESQHHCQRMR